MCNYFRKCHCYSNSVESGAGLQVDIQKAALQGGWRVIVSRGWGVIASGGWGVIVSGGGGVIVIRGWGVFYLFLEGGWGTLGWSDF